MNKNIMVKIEFPPQSTISDQEAINLVDSTIAKHPEWVTNEPLLQAKMIEVLFGRKYAIAYLTILSSGFLKEESDGHYVLQTMSADAIKHWELCERAFDGETIVVDAIGNTASIFSIWVKPINGEKRKKEFSYINIYPMLS